MPPAARVALVARLGARPRIDGRQGRPPHLAEDGLVDEVQLPRKAVGCVRAEAVLGGGCLDEAFRRGRQSGPVSPQVHLDALHDVRPLRSLRFGLLPMSRKKSAKPWKAESARSGASTEVVDTVAAHEEQQGHG